MTLKTRKKEKKMRMGKLTNRLYNDFNLEALGFDFMGYEFETKKDLTFHHIQPRSLGGETKYNNGALLNRDTSHNYIHTIENVDFKIFIELSYELRNIHNEGALTQENLIRIRNLLLFFERKYAHEYTKKGTPIIKEEYVRRRIKLWNVTLT